MTAPIADEAAAGEAPLWRRQRPVLIGMAIALAATVAVYALGLRPLPSGLSRDAVWPIAALGPLFCLVIAVGFLANRRFLSAQDIDAAAGGPPSHQASIAQAIIQNTLEQTVLALGLYALLARLLPDQALRLPLALSAAFVVGRLCFAVGYVHGAGGRSFGFGLTFYPTVTALLYAAWLAIAKV